MPGLVLPCLVDDMKQMQMLHDAWGHPSASMWYRIWKRLNGRGFPRNFVKLLPKFSCRVCSLCKGARAYRHTASFNKKAKFLSCYA